MKHLLTFIILISIALFALSVQGQDYMESCTDKGFSVAYCESLL